MKKRHEVLFEQLRDFRNELLSVVEGTSEQEAELIPEEFNNNIRWNLGHIYLDQYLWIQSLTKEDDQSFPPSFNQWFGFGTRPEDFTKDTPSFTSLLELLRQQPTEIMEKYGHRLEEEFPPTEMGMHTIEQVLVRTIFHEGLHLGAILAMKKHI